MSTEFSTNTFEYGDEAGLGAWTIGHYRQHLRYEAVLAALAPPIIIPTYPIIQFGGNRTEIRFWLDDHEKLHEQLRPIANVSGSNLADLDYDDPGFFYQWLDTHNAEHAQLDQAFGLA
jgi:hypothetical protein